MDDPEEYRRWRDRTEGRLATLERVTQEHTDQLNQHGEILTELKADFAIQKALIQAVHDVQSDHTARLNRLEQDVSVLKTDLARVKVDVAEMKVGVHTIIGLLTQEIDGQAG